MSIRPSARAAHRYGVRILQRGEWKTLKIFDNYGQAEIYFRDIKYAMISAGYEIEIVRVK
jgi:hypothetical protein